MRRKLGLLALDGAEEDQELINDLLQTMQDTGADFTNTFRCLSKFPMPSTATSGICASLVLENAMLHGHWWVQAAASRSTLCGHRSQDKAVH